MVDSRECQDGTPWVAVRYFGMAWVVINNKSERMIAILLDLKPVGISSLFAWGEICI